MKTKTYQNCILGENTEKSCFPTQHKQDIFGLCANLKEKSVLYFLPVSNVPKITILELCLHCWVTGVHKIDVQKEGPS